MASSASSIGTVSALSLAGAPQRDAGDGARRARRRTAQPWAAASQLAGPSARAGTGAASMVAQVGRRPAAAIAGLASTSRCEVDAGRDLGDREALGRQPHHAALGDVDHLLALLARAPAAEGDVLDLRHHLRDLALGLRSAAAPSSTCELARRP